MRRFTDWFVWSVGVILCVTAFAKLTSVVFPTRVLTTADPIFGVSLRFLFLGVSIVELILAFVCFGSFKRRTAVISIAWLSSIFFIYRLGLWQMGAQRPCSCMGGLFDALRVPQNVAETIMQAVLAYMLLGSICLLALEWTARWRTQRSLSALH